MILDDLNITLDMTNINVLKDIFNKHFDEEKHVPILYLVLDTNTLKHNEIIDIKVLMLEKQRSTDASGVETLKRQYLDYNFKLNINLIAPYTQFIQRLVHQKRQRKNIQFLLEHKIQHWSILKIKQNEVYLSFYPFMTTSTPEQFSFDTHLMITDQLTDYELQEYLIKEDQV